MYSHLKKRFTGNCSIRKQNNMKRSIILIPLLLSLSMAMAQKPIVVIDPGHGGVDSGAVGTNGILEKEVVMGIATECLRLNHTLFQDSLEIYLTRYKDTLISLGDRSRLAKILMADAFVSIHCNQAPNDKAQGFEVFVADGPVDPRSQKLAAAITDRFGTSLGIVDRGLKRANFQVLRETHGHFPSLLLETGFISNSIEAEHTRKTESRTAIALAILQSLTKTLYHD